MRNFAGWICWGLIAIGGLQAKIAQTEHTWRLAEGESSPPASIADAAFMVGAWRGTGLGGEAEEIWHAAVGKTMMGSFRAWKDDEIRFYEFFLLQPEGDSLVLRLKHFSADLHGWEAKDASESFRLIEIDPESQTLVFEGLTYQRTGDRLTAWVATSGNGSDARELTFEFTLRQD